MIPYRTLPRGGGGVSSDLKYLSTFGDFLMYLSFIREKHYVRTQMRRRRRKIEDLGTDINGDLGVCNEYCVASTRLWRESRQI